MGEAETPTTFSAPTTADAGSFAGSNSPTVNPSSQASWPNVRQSNLVALDVPKFDIDAVRAALRKPQSEESTFRGEEKEIFEDFGRL
jgi:hypothetical protein